MSPESRTGASQQRVREHQTMGMRGQRGGDLSGDFGAPGSCVKGDEAEVGFWYGQVSL